MTGKHFDDGKHLNIFRLYERRQSLGVVLRLDRPLFSASFTQELSYPFPLKIIRLWFLIVFLISLLKSDLKSSLFSRISANWLSTSATIVLSTIIGPAMEKAEPSIRNSNLFPVKAKGDVRFRSVVSFCQCGRTVAPLPLRFCPYMYKGIILEVNLKFRSVHPQRTLTQ